MLKGHSWYKILLNKRAIVSLATWEMDAHETVYLTFDTTTCLMATVKPEWRGMDKTGDGEVKEEGQLWMVLRWISLAFRVNTFALQVNFKQFHIQNSLETLCLLSDTIYKQHIPSTLILSNYSIKQTNKQNIRKRCFKML